MRVCVCVFMYELSKVLAIIVNCMFCINLKSLSIVCMYILIYYIIYFIIYFIIYIFTTL